MSHLGGVFDGKPVGLLNWDFWVTNHSFSQGPHNGPFLGWHLRSPRLTHLPHIGPTHKGPPIHIEGEHHILLASHLSVMANKEG